MCQCVTNHLPAGLHSLLSCLSHYSHIFGIWWDWHPPTAGQKIPCGAGIWLWKGIIKLSVPVAVSTWNGREKSVLCRDYTHSHITSYSSPEPGISRFKLPVNYIAVEFSLSLGFHSCPYSSLWFVGSQKIPWICDSSKWAKAVCQLLRNECSRATTPKVYAATFPARIPGNLRINVQKATDFYQDPFTG